MGLQFLFGRSGVGKSKYLRDSIIEASLKNPNTNYCIMVPEQSNLQTQTDYVLNHPRGGILNIDILSFKRLAYRIFTEVGGFNDRVLDESGKLMILKKVVEGSKDKLTILQKPLERIDSLDKMKSVISEFSQYHISRESFDSLFREDLFPGLNGKLEDLLTVYEDFLEYISGKYITDEQVMDVLAEKLPLSDYVKNTVFVFDEYTGFTYLQNEVVRQLLKNAMDVIISLTMDASLINEVVVPEHNLFALSVKTKTEVSNIALEERVQIHKPICITEENQHKEKEFVFLEKNIFDYSAPRFNESTDRIVISACSSLEKEVLFIRNTISRLVRDEGYSYKDIAVVTGSLSKYGVFFEKCFKEAGIPCFVDDSMNSCENLFVESIRALLDIVIDNFSYKSVFRFLKTNLYYDFEDVDLLENYCISTGVSSFSKWHNEWTRPIHNQSADELAKLNELRAAFVADLAEFVSVMKDKHSTVRDKAYSLYTFFADTNTELRLKNMADGFAQNDDYINHIEYKQIYGAVIKLIDELVEIMGDEVISVDEFSELLYTGFTAIKIGVLPPGNDYVVLADVERSRISQTKVMFLLGANEGIIPKESESANFLNESERIVLKDLKIQLAPTSHEEYYTQKYYLYRMLTKASEKLYITYCSYIGGEKSNPAYVVNSIEDMFPNCVHINGNTFLKNNPFESKSDAFDYLLKTEKSSYWEELYDYLLKDEDYKKRLDMLQLGKMYKDDSRSLGEALAKRLYYRNDEFVTSVSRLETYSECPYKHFLQYGLQVNEREKSEMDAMDIGSIFHGALESYISTLNDMDLTVDTVSDDASDALITQCITQAFDSINRSYNKPTSREHYFILRMIRLMKRTIWAMKKHFEGSNYKINQVEKRFDGKTSYHPIAIGDNRRVYVNGKIDRVDTLVMDDKEYVRVVDYKTGSSSFSLLKFYHGLQLQLMLYLDVATYSLTSSENTTIVPTGAFYYRIQDPLIDSTKLKKDSLESLMLKELRLDGFENEKVTSGQLKSISEKSLMDMMKYVQNKVGSLSEDLLSGNVEKSPFVLNEGGIRTACEWCGYRNICQFDSSLPWCKERYLERYSDSDILNMISEKEGVDSELD